jgi:soluble lytic murein transglycosylase
MVFPFRVSANWATWSRGALLVCALVFGASGGVQAAQELAAPTKTGEVTVPVVDPGPQIPDVLSETDRERYRKIFAHQETGRWGRADKVVAKLEDKRLMGHVLYDRYMHPTKYRSKYVELSRWLKKYGDHPGAKRVYKLAVKRRPANYKHPKKPARVALPSYGDHYSGGKYKSPRKRGRKLRREVRSYKIKIRRNLRRGRPTRALQILDQKRVQKVLDRVEIDDQRARIAAGYFFANKDKKALELAAAAADRSRKHVKLADWTAGLAAWRLGQYELSAHHFEQIAVAPRMSDWYRSAGAFWSARAHLTARQPAEVNRMLDIAATYPRTFYGLVALRQLGQPAPLDWSEPPFEPSDLAKLMDTTAIKRVIALTEIDQDHRAERELRLLSGRNGTALDRSLLGLANHLNLPATQMRLGRQHIADGGPAYDRAIYPLPNWEPRGGFNLDRAVIYAFMRQESRFNSHAKSSAGARGVMQLMPRTASFIGHDRSLRWSNRAKLFIPEFNMHLGQKYLNHLRGFNKRHKDLFSLAVAYNGGPGNLRKWRRRIGENVDPLMFIESIPSRESRGYVERVLSNLWIYRMRLGQPTPSLDAVAAGDWPTYMAMDGKSSNDLQQASNPLTMASDTP